MPIKDPTIYPRHWKQFSLYIRTERSGGKCEVCGVCNYWYRIKHRRGYKGPREYIVSKLDGLTKNDGVILRQAKIVLTVAHLDAEGDVCRCQDETGYLCAKPDHVKAMCQKCHNGYDRPKRNKNARVTNEAKKDERRGLFVND